VNYNRKDLLQGCIDSVRKQSIKDIEIIMVDNGSSDGSAEAVKADYPEVKVIKNRENLYFCRANNQGIKEAKGEFILCLNSDCVLGKDYLKEGLSSFGLDEKIGMVSGKILRMDKRTIDSTGLFVARNRKPLERGYGKPDKGQYDTPEYIFGVSGACMFMKKIMLDDIKGENGYFDETFEIYYEDLDLCWRAQRKGWKAYYNPKAVAYHERGATAIAKQRYCEAEQNKAEAISKIVSMPLALRNDILFKYLSDDLKKRYIRNRYKCMKKNDSISGFLINLPFIILYEFKMRFYIIGNFILTSRKRHSII
jgi:GT2 family glycosyltransferase